MYAQFLFFTQKDSKFIIWGDQDGDDLILNINVKSGLFVAITIESVTSESVIAGNNQKLLAFVERCEASKELFYLDVLGGRTSTTNFLIQSRYEDE
jgi:hypothetical protein